MARMRCSSPKRKFRRARIVQAEGVERVDSVVWWFTRMLVSAFCGAQSEPLHDDCQDRGLPVHRRW